MTPEKTAEALSATASALWSCALCNSTDYQRNLLRWMLTPRLGDLIWLPYVSRYEPALDRVGVYADLWTYLGSGFPHEVWGLEKLDGEYVKWSNVEIVRIPRNLAEYVEVNTWTKSPYVWSCDA